MPTGQEGVNGQPLGTHGAAVAAQASDRPLQGWGASCPRAAVSYYGSPPSAVARPAEHQGCGGRGGVGGADEVGLERTCDGGPAYERRCEPAKGRAWPRRPPRGPSGRVRRARQATTDRAPRGGCSALRAEQSLLIVCNCRFVGLYMHEGNNPHLLVTARVKSLSGIWARATVLALSGRRATTVGGTVVAGK